MKKFNINISSVLSLSAILLFIFIMYLSLFSNNTSVQISPLVGKPAPGFVLNTFNNDTLNLDSLKGKSVILNFWSSWCIPCKKETSVINRANSKYQGNDIVFIGVNIWDDKENALNFLNNYPSDYINGFDPTKEIHVNYGIQGVPETFFISKEGIILERFQGELNENIINYFSSQLLQNKS